MVEIFQIQQWRARIRIAQNDCRKGVREYNQKYHEHQNTKQVKIVFKKVHRIASLDSNRYTNTNDACLITSKQIIYLKENRTPICS